MDHLAKLVVDGIEININDDWDFDGEKMVGAAFYSSNHRAIFVDCDDIFVNKHLFEGYLELLLLHEMGHALIHHYNIVCDDEEDMANRIAIDCSRNNRAQFVYYKAFKIALNFGRPYNVADVEELYTILETVGL